MQGGGVSRREGTKNSYSWGANILRRNSEVRPQNIPAAAPPRRRGALYSAQARGS